MERPGLFSEFLTFAVLLATSASGAVVAQTPAAMFDQPLLITSAGQSPDVQLAAILAKRAGIDYTLVKLATTEDLGGAKTLAVVVGASLKGLGAAGIDTNKEKDRVRSLLAEARAMGIPVLVLHLGGEQRRGELTDEMIADTLPAAKMAVILKSGNKDGLFTKLCGENGTPLVEVERTADAADVLKNAFRSKSGGAPAVAADGENGADEADQGV